MTVEMEEKRLLRVKSLKVLLVAIFIISWGLLQGFIAEVPIATASESHLIGDSDAPRTLPDVFPDNWSVHPPIHVRRGLNPAISSPIALSPSQIKAVYNLPSTGGSGTIAIIDAYDDPNVENDLNVFSSQFGLPLCTSANGCFEKHMMSSSIIHDWEDEISLDTQWAHAIAPNAKILLVEANSASINDFLAAVDYARTRPDVVAISMSVGVNEFSGESSLDSHFTSSYGAIFFASSGDDGAGVQWPAVSSNVIAVGGTSLAFYPDGSLASETAWSGSGGGLSKYESEPSYQVSYNVPNAGGKRAVPDVSYNADYLNSAVPVYILGGWWYVGGTSAGAPQWAAIHSLGLSTSNNNFYQESKSVNYPSYFRDITSGSNGVCGFYCTAATGYDYVTGLGSPLTITYKMPGITKITVSPPTATVVASNATDFTAVTLDLFGNPVSVILTWNSSNATVGNINSSGMFIAQISGTTNITASNGTIISANVTVIVTAAPTLLVSASPTSVTVGTPTNVTFTLTSNGSAVSGATVTLSGIATGSNTTDANGNTTFSVNAIGAGTITATASLTGYTGGSTTVSAGVPSITNVTITPTTPSAGSEMNITVAINNPGASFNGRVEGNVWSPSGTGKYLGWENVVIPYGASAVTIIGPAGGAESSYEPHQAGTYLYDVFLENVDMGQVYLNPTDSKKGVPFSVGAAADMYINNVTLSASPTVGSVMTLNVTISNPTASAFVGTMDANIWDSARGYVLTPQPISIAASGSTTLTFSYTPVNHGLHSYDFFMVSDISGQNTKAPWSFQCVDYSAGVEYTVG